MRFLPLLFVQFLFSQTLLPCKESSPKFSQNLIVVNKEETINLNQKLNLANPSTFHYLFYNSKDQLIENPNSYKILLDEGTYDHWVMSKVENCKSDKFKFTLKVNKISSHSLPAFVSQPVSKKRIKRVGDIKDYFALAVAAFCLRRNLPPQNNNYLVNLCPEEEIELAEEAREIPPETQIPRSDALHPIEEAVEAKESEPAFGTTPEPIAGPSSRNDDLLVSFNQELNFLSRYSKKYSQRDLENKSSSESKENLQGWDISSQLNALLESRESQSDDFSLDEIQVHGDRSNPIPIPRVTTYPSLSPEVEVVIGSPPRDPAPIHQLNAGNLLNQVEVAPLPVMVPLQVEDYSSEDEGIGLEEEDQDQQDDLPNLPHFDFKRDINYAEGVTSPVVQQGKMSEEILEFFFVFDKISVINKYSSLILSLFTKQDLSMNAFSSISTLFTNKAIIKMTSYTPQEIENLFDKEQAKITQQKWYFQFVLDNVLDLFKNQLDKTLNNIIAQLPGENQKIIDLFRRLLLKTEVLRTNCQEIIKKIKEVKTKLDSIKNWYKSIENKIQFIANQDIAYTGACFRDSSLRKLNLDEGLSDFFYMLENHLTIKSSLENVLNKRISLLDGKFKLSKAKNLLGKETPEDKVKIDSIDNKIILIEDSLSEDKYKNTQIYKELFKTPYLLCYNSLPNKKTFFVKRKFEELNRRVDIRLLAEENDRKFSLINENHSLIWNRKGILDVGEIKKNELRSNVHYKIELDIKDKDQKDWQFISINKVFLDDTFLQKQEQIKSSTTDRAQTGLNPTDRSQVDLNPSKITYQVGPNPSSNGDLFITRSEDCPDKDMKIQYSIADEQGNRVCLIRSTILFPSYQKVLNLEIKSRCNLPRGRYFLRVIDRIGRESKDELINEWVIFE